MSRAFSRFADASGRAEPPKLLGEEWLTRWRRSDAKFPATLPVAAREEFEGSVRKVQQKDGSW
jgi:hypothetical protein